MNGSTQSGALDGQTNDIWFQQPSNSMAFYINAIGDRQAVALLGYAGRLVLAEMGGVLDKCAIAFRSDTPLTMALAATPPLTLRTEGSVAADLPAWLVRRWDGHVAGSLLFPQTASAACRLDVSADGTVTLDAGGRTWSAQVSGGATAGDRDAAAEGRLSAYGALTGARGWTWTLSAQSPADASQSQQIDIEIAHTPERSQVSFVQAQIRPAAGGNASRFDSCYFPN
jgi:hypothetical protein